METDGRLDTPKIQIVPTETHDIIPQIAQRDQLFPILGVGKLAEVIGPEDAREFFKERNDRRQFLYTRALRRWGPPGQGYTRSRSRQRTKTEEIVDDVMPDVLEEQT